MNTKEEAAFGNVVPCEVISRPLQLLEQEGWQQFWSFRVTDEKQLSDAIKKIKDAQSYDMWEVVAVNGQDDLEVKAGVMYLYKRKGKGWSDAYVKRITPETQKKVRGIL